jgi:hypothetical protein
MDDKPRYWVRTEAVWLRLSASPELARLGDVCSLDRVVPRRDTDYAYEAASFLRSQLFLWNDWGFSWNAQMEGRALSVTLYGRMSAGNRELLQVIAKEAPRRAR